MKQNTPSIEQRHILMIINFLMVSVMLTCFAFIFGKFFQPLFPGWSNVLFPTLAFLIALESLIFRYSQRTSSKIIHNPLLTLLTEIIIILLLVKLISMSLAGFSTIFIEITSWQQDFLTNFFNPDYLIRAFGLLIIWLMALLISQPLTQIEEDEELMEQEKLGYTFNDRYDARRRLIGFVFFLGFIMIVLMVVMKSDLKILPFQTTSSDAFLTVLLIYFFSAFVLLSLNQYAIMKARWYFREISVSTDLAKRWFFYTITFIIIVILLILLLPTDFSLGFLPFARFISQAGSYLFAIIQFILFIPIALVIALLNALFPGEFTNDPSFESMPELSPIIPQMANTSPWWEVVKSFLFWIVFLSVIFFSIRYYLKNRQDLVNFLREIRIIAWLRDIWKWVQKGFKEVSQATTLTIKQGINEVKRYFKNRQMYLPSLDQLVQRIPPRQAVIMTYVNWIRWNRQHGFERKKYQTPLEYAQVYGEDFPDSKDILTDFTKGFINARYSTQSINKIQVQEAQKQLIDLKESFLQRQKMINGKSG